MLSNGLAHRIPAPSCRRAPRGPPAPAPHEGMRTDRSWGPRTEAYRRTGRRDSCRAPRCSWRSSPRESRVATAAVRVSRQRPHMVPLPAGTAAAPAATTQPMAHRAWPPRPAPGSRMARLTAAASRGRGGSARRAACGAQRRRAHRACARRLRLRSCSCPTAGAARPKRTEAWRRSRSAAWQGAFVCEGEVVPLWQALDRRREASLLLRSALLDALPCLLGFCLGGASAGAEHGGSVQLHDLRERQLWLYRTLSVSLRAAA